jgi:hypothetical protein
MHIREGDKHKVAFITPEGLYEHMVMQFSPLNVPRMVDEILVEEWVSGHVEVYIDDILVHTPDVLTNWYWTTHVLDKLWDNQLCCRASKCQFEMKEVEFLGLVVLAGNISVSHSKVKVIWEEKRPTMKKGVQHFLGLMNYHCHFIRDYSCIT